MPRYFPQRQIGRVVRLRITLRTVVRDTDNVRTISLIGKC